jgi:hypothetical protein
MSLGFPTTKLDVDSRAGQLALTLRDDLNQIQTFKAWLDTQTDANLIALGYVQAEVNTLRSAYVDLDQFRQVYQGLATRTPAYDYRTFAKLLVGVV